MYLEAGLGDPTVILRFAYQHEILAGKQGRNSHKHASAGRIAQKKHLGERRMGERDQEEKAR